MTQDEIWQALKSSVLEVFPEYNHVNLFPEMSLRELGANSVDRVEIIILTLSRLNLNISLIEFASTKKMADIVDLLCHHLETV